MREKIHLNFGWYFSQSFKKEHLIDFKNLDDFDKVDLPHTDLELPFNYLPEGINVLITTYKKLLYFNSNWKNKRLHLRFEGIAHAADIYLDDKFLFRHEGGYTDFKVDISEEVSFETEQILTIVVDNHENENIPPFGNQVDYLGYGGIYREVSLEILEPEHIIAAYLDCPNIDSNLINFKLESSVDTGEYLIQIFDKEQEVFFNRYPLLGNLSIFQVELSEKSLWSLDNPYLYDVKISLYTDKTKDEINLRFGFRSAVFTKDGFYLNHEKVKLRGLNRHQSYPYVGYAMPKSAQVKDADILKYDLGLNIVRTSHYPQSRHFLNRCDEIGLLVFEEIPGWQYLGKEKFRENTLKNVEAMIKRDYNHPSIILWGVRINESPDDHDLFEKTNKLARSLDSTRPTGGVRNFPNSEFLEDVYTYNDFVHAGDNEGLRNPDQVKKNVPYLVTEYNGHMYPTKKYDVEKVRVEHALRHYRVIDAAYLSNRITGTIGWCMNDYNTHDDFGSGDNICYHGVLDMYRLPKYASYIYSSQQSKKPVLEVLTTLNAGEYPMSFMDDIYIASNLDYIKLYQENLYIDTFYPDKESKLPHPLIVVNDLIGNQLIEKEGFSKRDSDLVKKIFKLIPRYGHALPLRYKLRMFVLMKKYHLKIVDGINLYYKYCNPASNYRFVGYRENEPVKTVVREPVKFTTYHIEADSTVLEIGATYDVTRIIVSKYDQNRNLLPYAFDAFFVRVEGGAQLIGPELLSLSAGQMAFWVKTNGKDDTALVKVNFTGKELNIRLKINRRK